MTTTRHNNQQTTSNTATSIIYSIHSLPMIIQTNACKKFNDNIWNNSRCSSSWRSKRNQNRCTNICNRSNGSILTKSKCKTIFNRHLKRILIVILVSFTFVDMVHAGTCWEKRTQSGKCKHPMERNISKEKCCGGGDDVGFTEKELSEFEYFFATALGDGTACSSCIESCKTAKCGAHKNCVMRNGQPKCVCAPKCKVKNSRPKRVNRYSQSSDDHHVNENSSNPDKSSNSSSVSGSRKTNNKNKHSNRNGKRHQHQPNYQSPHQRINAMELDRTQFQSDKIISIIAPSSSSSTSSNSNSSHSYKKIIDPNAVATVTQVPLLPSNGNRNAMKSLQLTTKRHLLATVHSLHGPKQRATKTHNINGNNSSRIDNHIVGVNSRHQISSIEQEFTSKFHGHDIPYPPIDLVLYDNNQFHQAVCGTDGKTYKSECQLKRRACRQETTSLSVAYKGHCQTSCKHVQCPIGQHCLEDQNLMPHCVTCSITCPPYDPTVKSIISNPSRLVCGVDGNTYRNLCEIKRTACMLGRSIPVAYRGACKENANCDTVRCKDRQICLNDLVTHRPRCVSCSFKCPRRKRPQGQQSAFIKICGMNNKSYHSWCHMMRDACNTGYYIDVKHNGVCQNTTKT